MALCFLSPVPSILCIMKTRITELFGIEHPLVLAPMAGTSTAPLVAAVSAAGGLGLLGVPSVQGPEWLREQSEAVRATTANPYGAGFIQWVVEQRPELLDEALRLRLPVISLSFGRPEVYIERVKMAGLRVIYQAQTVDLARRAAAAGADAIVAQGTEAGGHTGRVSTLPLVPAIVDAVSPVPVIAAGGIADGRGIAAALMLGAEGVWLGTRFVASAESQTHPNTRKRIVEADSADTVLTHVYDIVSGAAFPDEFAGRALRNEFTALWHGREDELVEVVDKERPVVQSAQRSGDTGLSVVYAGEASGLIHDAPPAAAIVQRLMAEAEAILRNRPALLLDHHPAS